MKMLELKDMTKGKRVDTVLYSTNESPKPITYMISKVGDTHVLEFHDLDRPGDQYDHSLDEVIASAIENEISWSALSDGLVCSNPLGICGAFLENYRVPLIVRVRALEFVKLLADGYWYSHHSEELAWENEMQRIAAEESRKCSPINEGDSGPDER